MKSINSWKAFLAVAAIFASGCAPSYEPPASEIPNIPPATLEGGSTNAEAGSKNSIDGRNHRGDPSLPIK